MRILRLVALLSLSFPFVAQAAPGCGQVAGFTLTPSVSDVPNNTGGVLSSTWHTVQMQTDCQGFGTAFIVINSMNAAGTDSGQTVSFEGVSYKLFTTNLPDVYYFGAIIKPGVLTEFPFGTPYRADIYPPSGGTFSFFSTVKIRFYSPSGSMAPGARNVSSLQLVKGVVGGASGAGSANTVVYSSAFSFVVKGPSCQFAAPSQVKLDPANISTLRNPGDTSKAGTFSMYVTCGSTTPAYKVSYSMEDVYNPANRSSALTLANVAGSATGIGLQLMDGATPVTLGLSSKGTVGNIPRGGGFIGKPLSVNYIRTAVSAKPGVVKGGVVVTLSYE